MVALLKTALALLFFSFLFFGCVSQPVQESLESKGVKQVKRVLFVIAPQGFQDQELADSKAQVEAAGFKAVIASKKAGRCNGSLGGSVNAELGLSQVNSTSEFEAIVFIGGPGATVYFDDAEAHALARKFVQAGKVVAAICIAPVILAKAGVLKGRKGTVFSSGESDLEEGGAELTGTPVAVSGRVVTANGPPAASAFGKKITELLLNPPP